MVSDQEPRYRLVDANGNIVGSLYGKPDGSIAIQETDSGSDREVALAPDGTFSAPSVETPSLSAEDLESTNREGWGEPIYTESDIPDDPEISFNLDEPLDQGDELLIDIETIETDGGGELHLLSDQLSDGDYWHQQNNNTSPTTDSNQWLLASFNSSFPCISGQIQIRGREGTRTALLANLVVARGARLGSFIVAGGADDYALQDFTLRLEDVGGDNWRVNSWEVYSRSGRWDF